MIATAVVPAAPKQRASVTMKENPLLRPSVTAATDLIATIVTSGDAPGHARPLLQTHTNRYL